MGRGEVKCSMATKHTGAVLINWVGNNFPKFDKHIFWEDVQSIVTVNDQDVSVLLQTDAVVVQRVGKNNIPGPG